MRAYFRIIDKRGLPVFRLDEAVTEPGDSIRLLNYAKTLTDNIRWAFKCHEEASDAYREKRTGAKGMEFGNFVSRILFAGSYVSPTKLDNFKNEVNTLLDKLDPNNETVKELKKLCHVKTRAEQFREMFCNGS